MIDGVVFILNYFDSTGFRGIAMIDNDTVVATIEL